MGPEVLVPMGFFLMVLGIVVGTPLARAYARRMDKGMPAQLPSTDIVARLDRIEQAVEAVATEVERISEGQRFTTRLLSESRGASLPASTAPRQQDQDGTVLSDSARRP